MQVFVVAERNPCLDAAVGPAKWIDPPAGTIDAMGRIHVAALIQAFPKGERTLVITDRALTLPECGRLFGFSNDDRQIAVVSVWRLEEGGGTLARRLQNVITHELGHLDGLRHCSHARCLMRPAQTVADLDTRADAPCGRCPQKGKWWTWGWARNTAAVLAFVFLIAATQGAMRLAIPEFDAPYS